MSGRGPFSLFFLPVCLIVNCVLIAVPAASQDLPGSFDEFLKSGRIDRRIPENSDPDSPFSTSEPPRTSQPANTRSPVDTRSFQDFRPSTRESPAANFRFGSTPANSLRGSSGEVQPVSSGRRLPSNPAPLTNERSTNRLPAVYIQEFDWSHHSTSIVDLIFETSESFQHGTDFLAVPDEHVAYLDLVDTIARQKQQLRNTPRTTLAQQKALWEESFYRFTRARELAFQRGRLQAKKRDKSINGYANPFQSRTESLVGDQKLQAYDQLRDASDYPQHFVGRPVVMMGVFHPDNFETITDKEIVAPDVAIATEGNDIGDYRESKVLRGTLTDIQTKERLAIVDTSSILGPDGTPLASRNYSRRPQLVLVKGWFVKDFKGVPLIYTEQLRELNESPPTRLFVDHTVDRHRVSSTERWLYYETMRHLEVVPRLNQRQAAQKFLKFRIDQLMREVAQKATTDIKIMQTRQQNGKLSQEEFDRRVLTVKRQVKLRMNRYQNYLSKSEGFPTYVDIFNHSTAWQGHPVTLKGHVRHVVSYDGDDLLFDGRELHELWLFTADSQHNPAVIVTPNLPDGFPSEAEVVDGVSVTGVVFKRYVYDSQDSTRIAPLILAGHVTWTPNAEQVADLVEDGHLPASSDIAKAAAAQPKDRSSSTLLTVLAIFFVMLLMILWGRAQREERDRIRLRKRVSEDPEFENALRSGYRPEPALTGLGHTTSLVDELLNEHGYDSSYRPSEDR